MLRPRLTLSLLAAIGLASCSDSSSTLNTVQGELRLDPVQIDLGPVEVGRTRVARAELSALGGSVGYAGRVSSGSYEFSASPAYGTVQLGSPQQIMVRFAATEPGTRRAVFEYVSDRDSNNVVQLTVSAQAYIVPDCEDGNVCTTDSYDVQLGRCIHEENNIICDDLSACTTDDHCVEGVCKGTQQSCDDGDPCTSDYCDGMTGCINRTEVVCDDGNACTVGSCNADGQCTYTPVAAGTACENDNPCGGNACDDRGECAAGEPLLQTGEPCEDGDPCTDATCSAERECVDPNAPSKGDLKYSHALTLGPSAEQNPVLDGTGTLYTATSTAVLAIDRCGGRAWTGADYDTLEAPGFSRAMSTPGRLLVPYDARVVLFRSQDGSLLITPPAGEAPGLDLAAALSTLLDPADGAIADVQLLDLAIRSGLGYLASVSFTQGGAARGALIEVDRSLTVPTLFSALGSQTAVRVLVDRDGAAVVLLERTEGGRSYHQVRRFGLDNAATGSWASAELESPRGDISLGTDGAVLWSEGLVQLEPASGTPSLLDRRSANEGAIVGGLGLYLYESNSLLAFSPSGETLWSFTPDSGESLIGRPAVDSAETVFALTRDAAGEARLYGLQAGATVAGTPISLGPVAAGAAPSLTLSNARAIIAILPEDSGAGRIYAIQWNTQLSSGPWPRYRRDNFATQHR